MNILILNWRDLRHPLSGGAEISLLEHAKYWVQKGAKVTWFASSFTGGKEREIIDGIHIIRKGSMFTVHIHALFYYFQNFREIDIIFDNFHFIPFFSPLYARNKAIVAFINEPAREAWFKNGNIIIGTIGYILEPLFFLPYVKVPLLTGSDSIAAELLHYNVKKKLLSVVPHGMNVSPLKGDPKKSTYPVIIYLGQLAKDKGIEDALESFVLLKKVVPKARLWIVGKPSSEKYLQRIQNLIRNMHLKDDSTLFGYVTESRKNQLLEKAWVLIHPSIREGWGLNILEANSFGTPAVGYNISGLKDSIQDKKTGIITDKNTPYELSKEIISLLQDKKKYATLSRQARIFAKKFRWDKSGRLSWKIVKKTYESYKDK